MTEVKRIQAVGVVCICLYLVSLTVDGFLRWLCDSYGAPEALYLRDLLPLFGIVAAWVVSRAIGFIRWQRLMVGFLLFCFTWFAWGLLNGIPPAQGLFAIKTLTSIPTGAALWLILRNHDDRFSTFCLVLAVFVFAGVLADAFLDMPWAGLSYKIGSIAIEGQREWTIDNVERLAGFSRASFEAGMQIAVLGSVVVGSSMRGSVRLMVAAVLLIGALMTTSRASVLAFCIAGVLGVFFRFMPRSAQSSRRRRRSSVLPLFCQLLVWSPVLLVIGVFGFPFITESIDRMSKGGSLDMASFAMRTEGIWLEALQLLSSPETWLAGLGMGALGAAQVPFEPENFNPGDNLFIYTLINFGIVGSALVFVTISRSCRDLLASPISRPTYALCLFAVLTAGMLVTAVESPIAGVGLGLALAESISRFRENQQLFGA